MHRCATEEWDAIAQIFERGADIGGTWRVSLVPFIRDSHANQTD